MIFFDRITETSGILCSVGDYCSCAGNHFICLEVQSGNANNPEKILMQREDNLAKRIVNLNLSRFINNQIIISKDGDLYYFYIQKEDSIENHLIGMISDSFEWSKEEDKQWLVNDESGISHNEQASFFGRSIEDIESRYESIFYKILLKKTLYIQNKGTLNSLSSNLPKDVFIVGAVIKGNIIDDQYCGISYQNKEEKYVKEEDTLFILDSNQRNTLIDCLNDDILEISNSQNQLLSIPFFKNNIKDRVLPIYVWIKLEDAGNGLFNSYSYAFTDNKETITEHIKSREADFLRQIMYLRSLLTDKLEKFNEQEREETRRQAIKSVISAIMSRNMSHNLGSHVLYYTQRDLRAAASKSLSCFDTASALRGASHIVAFMKNRTNYVAAISEDGKFPSLPVAFKSEIFDYINIDKSPGQQKTINYYLKNLIRSEGFTRDDNGKDLLKGDLKISLLSNIHSDQEDINYLNLAFPGGVLSVHAFCNIIENFIRNSAKYWPDNISKKDKNLTFTLKVSIVGNDLCVVIYDDKKNVVYDNDLTTKLKYKIRNIKILNYDYSINKEDKGIKEMFVSYLWLISNLYIESLSDFISGVDLRDENFTWLIKNRFDFVAINDNGAVVDSKKVFGTNTNASLSLGLMFKLPIHYATYEITAADLTDIQTLSTDVVIAEEGLFVSRNLDKIFPRTFIKNSPTVPPPSANITEQNEKKKKECSILYTAMCNHFKEDIDKYKIWLGNFYEDFECKYENLIYFETHFNDKLLPYNDLIDYYDNYLYVDSISGGNYTDHLKQFLSEVSLPLPNWNDEILALKIKESAITRITVIDERLFNDIKRWIDLSNGATSNSGNFDIKDSQIDLALRNIRVLNFFGSQEVANQSLFIPVEGFEQLKGNEFRAVGPYKDYPNKTNFLTIHLGLIEKILKNSTEIESVCGTRGNNALSNDRIEKLFNKIQDVFSPDYICIHSGRGGLSKELESTILKEYPFVPFMTLEYLFNDSKFLLSQMFYSLKYHKI